MPSPLWPEPVFMTYRVWVLPLPIPLQFSDKQKHIQALASHFTLCALAGGNAFLEPLAYSPKNGSSWLSFLKKRKKEEAEDNTCGGLGPIFHPLRCLLTLDYQSHQCFRWAELSLRTHLLFFSFFFQHMYSPDSLSPYLSHPLSVFPWSRSLSFFF